ncbi:MAG: hypothetical protein EON93_02610 [Burkholderiales bacterium]|nr:MAG: hypothetical protein EON93_02610 [Burkholderiales bacterium]
MTDRIAALAWGVAALVTGGWALAIALGPKGDASGWVMVLMFGAVAGFCAWRMRRAWHEASRPSAPEHARAPVPAPDRPVQHEVEADVPDAGRPSPVSLEVQISALADAGLAMASGRTIDELLTSWARADYENDPYHLLLFMYGVEVEEAPWGRWFCERGWNFDMECLNAAGDYASAFGEIVRITGQPELVTDMSDDFDIDRESAHIRYTVNGRERVLEARVDNDWADPEAVRAFVQDIEDAVGGGQRFWAADNGQASVLFFLTDAAAARINSLRADTLQPYV